MPSVSGQLSLCHWSRLGQSGLSRESFWRDLVLAGRQLLYWTKALDRDRKIHWMENENKRELFLGSGTGCWAGLIDWTAFFRVTNTVKRLLFYSPCLSLYIWAWIKTAVFYHATTYVKQLTGQSSTCLLKSKSYFVQLALLPGTFSYITTNYFTI